MQIFDEVDRKKISLKCEDWQTSYEYLKNTINKRFDFKVEEGTFTFNDEKKEAAFKLTLSKNFDSHSKVEIDVLITFNTDKNSAEIELEGKLKTEFPSETPFQRSSVYFFLRTIWDRLYYGQIRGKYREESEKLMNSLIKSILETSKE